MLERQCQSIRSVRASGVGRLAVLCLSAGWLTVVGGCVSTPSGDDAGGLLEAETVSVGENLVGEDCWMQPGSSPTAPDGVQSFDIFCGAWEEPSARLSLVPAGGTPIASLTDPGSWWRADLDGRVVCAEARASEILNGLPAQLFSDCTFRDGGWPYVAVAVADGGRIVLADGIPAALPAIETAAGLAFGRLSSPRAVGPETYSAAIRQIEAQLPDGLFSAENLRAYGQLLQLAQEFNYTKDFASAERGYRDALRLHQRIVPEQNAGRAFTLMHIALNLSNQGRFAEAGPLFARSQALLSETINPSDVPRLVSYLAIHEANQGNAETALQLAREATRQRLELADRFGLTTDQTRESPAGRPGVPQPPAGVGAETAMGDAVRSLYTEATMQFILGDRGQAEATLDEATSYAGRDPNLPSHWQPEVLLQQARFAVAAGDHDRALRLLRQSIDAQHGLYSNSRTEGLAHLLLGRVFSELGRTADAFNAFRAGFRIIENQGGGLSFEQALPYFETVLARLERDPSRRDELLAELFEVSQSIRGSVTSQMIALAAARLADSEREVGDLIRSLQDARRERDNLYASLLQLQSADTAPLPEQLLDLDAELAAAEERLAQLELRVQSVAPEYNQLIALPVDAASVRAQLSPAEALLLVLVGNDRTLVILLRRDGLDAHLVDLGHQAALSSVHELRRAVEPPYEDVTYNVDEAYQLYDRLFGRIDDRLSAVEHVIAVPSGPFLSLPFGMLVTEPSVGRDYSDIAWMIRRQAITLAPSVRSFVHIRDVALPSRAPRPYIGFGDSIPGGNAEAILRARQLSDSCLEDAAAVANFRRLPATERELRAAAASLSAGPGSIVTGSDFTESEIQRRPLDEYRIVHFATHGLLPGQLDCWSEPALLVSRPQGSDPQEDGLLDAAEILNLDLDADLVILSACYTAGAGANTGGESLSGLARAFFYAGARSLIATHWWVDDQASAELLVGLFGRARSGATGTAEALRQSQLDLIGDWRTSHPIFWAGFTLVGDGGQTL